MNRRFLIALGVFLCGSTSWSRQAWADEHDDVDATEHPTNPSDESTAPNPVTTRYLYSSSAIPMHQGQWTASQTMLAISAVNYAVTDHFSVRYRGFVFYPNLLSIFGAQASTSIRDGLHLSVGSEVVFIDSDLTAVAFGAVTIGHDNKHMTLATGYADGQTLRRPSIPLVIAGQYRTRWPVSFVTENWIFVDQADYLEGKRYRAVSAFLGNLVIRLNEDGRPLRSPSPRRSARFNAIWRPTIDLGLAAFGNRYQKGEYDIATRDWVQSEFNFWDLTAPIPWLDLTWSFTPSSR